MSPEDYATIAMMRKYGGSFVQALANAYDCADYINPAKIRSAWPDYWNQYERLGAKFILI